MEKGQIVPTEVTVTLLMKAIRSRQAKRFLVDGFPRGVEQALCLEKSFREIDFIVNLVVPEEVLFERLMGRALTSGRADDNPETIRNRIAVFNESTAPVLDTYHRLGKVANIPGTGDIEAIYAQVRKAIVPNMIFLYGAPCTGKSTVARQLCEATGYRYFSLAEFWRANSCASDVDKLNKLMRFFGETAERNFVVDSYLDNRAQSVVFLEHFGKPRYVLYLQSAKDEVEQNVRRYSRSDEEKRARLQALQDFLKCRDELLSHLQPQPFFRVVNAVHPTTTMHTHYLHYCRSTPSRTSPRRCSRWYGPRC